MNEKQDVYKIWNDVIQDTRSDDLVEEFARRLLATLKLVAWMNREGTVISRNKNDFPSGVEIIKLYAAPAPKGIAVTVEELDEICEDFELCGGHEVGSYKRLKAKWRELTGAPRFQNVTCSQCGGEFGPGDHGFSHCENHKGKWRIG